MREINSTLVGTDLLAMLAEEEPLEEDIGILDSDGKVLGVVISPEAYRFFLKKLEEEEEEDRLDDESVNEFHRRPPVFSSSRL
ncbi:hypothetical protein HNQ59_003360 [Chitinivorax tropicus]|uniref:Uncharacterized protein n=1 Tax=Chitinivorax tropicus TaxID=714531 RepID=A0A840MSB8_9PROT|nr:hypothetical protein [Chitinivorax tropicus]MBB5020047.1 hypothetical protein [Chitinivorax tropicus]